MSRMLIICYIFILSYASALAAAVPAATPAPAALYVRAPHPHALGRHGDEALAAVKRGVSASVPLDQLGPPSFPAQYPSCVKCQQNYGSISSCAQAASVFENATSIFNSPMAYISVLKCACTDTFQAVYPQCLDCFQHTNQCQYLGTDPAGTGAGSIVTNIRQICGFGSALLGGVAAANGMNSTTPATAVPTYTDVSQTGAGYQDQTAGKIFGAAASLRAGPASALALLATAMAAGLLML